MSIERKQGLLQMFVIYHDLEAPGNPGMHFAVREFLITGVTKAVAGELVALTTTLEEARLMVPVFADHRINRSDTDAPEIVETWV